jgi:hypothetical protein
LRDLQEFFWYMSKPKIFLVLCILFAISVTGCSVPILTGEFIPAVGVTPDQVRLDNKECYMRSSDFWDVPLTTEEENRIDGHETGRLFERGRGRNRGSDRYFLCMLDRNYQWVEYRPYWFPLSKCELLDRYQKGGIDVNRLKYLCDTQYKDEKCEVCK